MWHSAMVALIWGGSFDKKEASDTPPTPRILLPLTWLLIHNVCSFSQTVSSRPAKEDSLSLRERLGWFSAASKSNVGSLGDPHRSAPQEVTVAPGPLLGSPSPSYSVSGELEVKL